MSKVKTLDLWKWFLNYGKYNRSLPVSIDQCNNTKSPFLSEHLILMNSATLIRQNYSHSHPPGWIYSVSFVNLLRLLQLFFGHE